MKYKEWLEIWLTKYTKYSVRVRTYEKYKYIVDKHIVNFLGDYDMDELSGSILQDFVLTKIECGNLKTGKGLSNNTVISICNILKRSIKECNNLNYTTTDNSNKIKLPQHREKQVTAFEKFEQEKIEKFCIKHKKPNYLGIVICLYTGIRIGELFALSYDDIDFKKCVMSINKTTYQTKRDGKVIRIVDRPKTSSSIRDIPLPKNIVQLLQKNKKLTKSRYVITTRTKGMVEMRSYQRTYQIILKKLKIQYKNFHSLRHTFATRATEIGADARTVSEILGHKNPIITLQRYTHSMTIHKVGMMNKLGNNLKLD